MSNQSKKEIEKMTSFTMRVRPSLLDRAREKAGLVPLSTVIRLLIEKWLNGEIIIEQTKD
jgi:hypothetical protein